MNTGQHEATIVSNDIRAAGTGAEFVYLLLDIGGDRIAAQVWLTKKAINMAKHQLRACGFDTASEGLSILKENHGHLAGKKVKVEVAEEEYQGKVTLKARILTGEVTKKRISEIDALFKSKEVADEDDIPF
jgi:hypothetical protein